MQTLAWIAAITLVVTSVGLLISRNWRLSIILLSIQYLAMFILLLVRLPIGLASVKVVSGWMSSAVLGMTRSGMTGATSVDEESIWPRGRLFRIFMAGVVGIMVIAATPTVENLMADAGFAITVGSLMLIAMGLLHLGITSQILRVTLGLLTVLTGFEILYSTVEDSALVTALLAMITLGLSLVGSYLMIATGASEVEPS
jgi:hypothetical protein